MMPTTTLGLLLAASLVLAAVTLPWPARGSP